jgi:hypothetical protein
VEFSGDADGIEYSLTLKPEHFVRAANPSPAGLSALAAAGDDVDPLAAKKRGLLAVVASLIMLAPDKRLAEPRLFELLESTGLRDGGGGRRREEEGDGDDDEGGTVIPGWRRIVQVEFVRADFLERGLPKSDLDGPGPESGSGAKVYVYSLGPRSRAVVGAPHLLEWVCATTGRAMPAERGGHLKLALGPEGPDVAALIKATNTERARAPA